MQILSPDYLIDIIEKMKASILVPKWAQKDFNKVLELFNFFDNVYYTLR